MKRIAALLSGVLLVTGSVQAATVTFTPVPFVDMNQQFNLTTNLPPTVFDVRIASTGLANFSSVDMIVGSPLDSGSLAVSFPNDASRLTTDSIQLNQAFIDNTDFRDVDHPNDNTTGADPLFTCPGGYGDCFFAGGANISFDPFVAPYLFGRLTIDPITAVGEYTFGIDDVTDGNGGSFIGDGFNPNEALSGRVMIKVIPEPTTIALMGIAALGLIRRRTVA